MSPLPAVKRPSIEEFLELVQGPRVEISVGVGEEKKLFTVPKALLCYYSKVFDRCFNGNFKEAQTQKLELPEDKGVFFEALLLFMLQGVIAKIFIPKFGIGRFHMVGLCLDFLQYTDKYGLGSMGADIVYEAMRDSWGWANDEEDYCIITGDDIEVVFAIAPVEHPLRNLVLRTALLVQMDEVGELLPENHKFLEQEAKTEGFAAGLLRIIFNHGGASLDIDTLRSLHD